VAPIIELGAGFDVDLTGRENIYFNASLLGMTREQVRQREAEIIEFAALGEAIDAPLRTFSTGMVARLAFAIATTVDADIVLLDEILSVGDAAFRQKCEERIRSFCDGGSTVVLVSHELGAVRALCRSVVWLDGGQVRDFGPAEEVIERYERSFYAEQVPVRPSSSADDTARIEPTSTRASGGRVELRGAFPDDPVVTVGGLPARVISATGKRIVIDSPRLDPGRLYDVVVTTKAKNRSVVFPVTLVTDYDDVPRGHLLHSYYERGIRLAILPLDPGTTARADEPLTRAVALRTLGTIAKFYDSSPAQDAYELMAKKDDAAPVRRVDLARAIVTLRSGAAYVPTEEPRGVFADMPIDDPATPFVEELYRLGITSGAAANPLRFLPDVIATRGQFVKMVVAALDSHANPPDSEVREKAG
jgi:hypothetical protein